MFRAEHTGAHLPLALTLHHYHLSKPCLGVRRQQRHLFIAWFRDTQSCSGSLQRVHLCSEAMYTHLRGYTTADHAFRVTAVCKRISPRAYETRITILHYELRTSRRVEDTPSSSGSCTITATFSSIRRYRNKRRTNLDYWEISEISEI